MAPSPSSSVSIKTMKQSLEVRLWQPFLGQDLERRLGSVLEHYAFHRPHTVGSYSRCFDQALFRSIDQAIQGRVTLA